MKNAAGPVTVTVQHSVCLVFQQALFICFALFVLAFHVISMFGPHSIVLVPACNSHFVRFGTSAVPHHPVSVHNAYVKIDSDPMKLLSKISCWLLSHLGASLMISKALSRSFG